MPVFLAFVAGGIFAAVISESTKKNIKTVDDEFQNLLKDRRELIQAIDEILREKEQSGEIKIERN